MKTGQGMWFPIPSCLSSLLLLNYRRLCNLKDFCMLFCCVHEAFLGSMPRKHHCDGEHFWLKYRIVHTEDDCTVGIIGSPTLSPTEIQRQVQFSVNIANFGFKSKEKRDSRQEQLHLREYFVFFFSLWYLCSFSHHNMGDVSQEFLLSHSFAPAHNSGKELALGVLSWTHVKSTLASTWSFWWPKIILMSYSLACYCLQSLVCLSNLDLTGGS